jgi:hypothetical protein
VAALFLATLLAMEPLRSYVLQSFQRMPSPEAKSPFFVGHTTMRPLKLLFVPLSQSGPAQSFSYAFSYSFAWTLIVSLARRLPFHTCFLLSVTCDITYFSIVFDSIFFLFVFFLL